MTYKSLLCRFLKEHKIYKSLIKNEIYKTNIINGYISLSPYSIISVLSTLKTIKIYKKDEVKWKKLLKEINIKLDKLDRHQFIFNFLTQNNLITLFENFNRNKTINRIIDDFIVRYGIINFFNCFLDFSIFNADYSLWYKITNQWHIYLLDTVLERQKYLKL